MPLHHKSTTGRRRQYVLDTNVLISDPLAISRFEEHNVVIPFLVIEELDRIKDSPRKVDVQHDARSAIQCINAVVNGHDKTSIRNGMALSIDDGKTKLADGQLRIINHLEFTATSGLPAGVSDLGISMETPDNQILMLVHQLSCQEADVDTILVTKDLNMRLKAKYLGLLVEDYKNEQEVQDVTLMSKGYVHITGSLVSFLSEYTSTASRLIVDADVLLKALREHLGEDRFELHANQAIVENGGTGAVWFVRADKDGPLSGNITLQCKSEEQLMATSASGIRPKDMAQALALDALLDDNIDLVTISGPAGSGKTLIAIAAALEQVIEHNRFDKIIMTRNIVDIGEPIGFLPGTEEEKMAPWMAALFDTLEALTNMDDSRGEHSISGHPGKLSNSNAKAVTYEQFMRHIQLRSMSLMRGRSFQRKFLVFDESQNLTRSQLKSMVTRAGEGSKVVIMGNIGQIDARWNGPTSNGLVSAVNTFKDFRKGAHIILTSGQRSDVATYAEQSL